MEAIRQPANLPWIPDVMIDVDIDNQTFWIAIPPCIARSSVGQKLVQRIWSNTWSYHTRSDVQDRRGSALEPTSTNGMLKYERKLGIREEAVHTCVQCGQRGLKKCSRCLLVYYCSSECQKGNWKQHKKNCTPMESTLEEHFAIAVPGFKCFFHYQGTLEKQKSEDGVLGICILSQEKFIDMYGQDGLYRTCVDLALYGKPSMFLINVCGQASMASSSSAENVNEQFNEETEN